MRRDGSAPGSALWRTGFYVSALASAGWIIEPALCALNFAVWTLFFYVWTDGFALWSTEVRVWTLEWAPRALFWGGRSPKGMEPSLFGARRPPKGMEPYPFWARRSQKGMESALFWARRSLAGTEPSPSWARRSPKRAQCALFWGLSAPKGDGTFPKKVLQRTATGIRSRRTARNRSKASHLAASSAFAGGSGNRCRVRCAPQEYLESRDLERWQEGEGGEDLRPWAQPRIAGSRAGWISCTPSPGGRLVSVEALRPGDAYSVVPRVELARSGTLKAKSRSQAERYGAASLRVECISSRITFRARSLIRAQISRNPAASIR
jgi:hypothetical protein